MRKIILASRSKARQKLLKEVGLKFRVVKSDARESRTLGSSPGELVVKNALAKAEDVAGKLRSGVVIGADTVVLAGKKTVGKPKDIKDAINMLKLLQKRPHFVYTGIAVVDIDKNRKFTAYEKTKVYMQRLSDMEIKNYFKKVSPLDKAGSFDIQGLGGLFIDRIEGCFYNVVGLPLAKLTKLLKKAGVDIF
ncbi:MAG: Maf family protein [bacterium]